MPKRIAPWLRNTFISLFVVTALFVPLAAWVMPRVVQWQLLSHLDSPDFDQREKALNFVIRYAGQRETVKQGAIATLTGAQDETNFIQIASALQRADQWNGKVIPQKPWLRWLGILANDPNGESRIQAAQQLADLPQYASDPTFTAMLAALRADAKSDVRYNALVATAELGDVIAVKSMTADADPLIAREAWLFLGIMKADAAPDETAPPLVAEAMQWALTGKLPQASAVDMSPLDLIETLPVGEHDEAVTDDMTDTLVIAVTAVTKTPNADAFFRVFDSPFPFIRDRAAIVAAGRFDDETNTKLIRKALADYDDNAKRTGAILSGLTGLAGDVLTKKAHDEDVWAVRQVQRLGLWMQQREPAMTTGVAEGLLTRDDLPTTTVLLAMLKQDRQTAMNYILSPRTDEPIFDASSLGLTAEEPDGEVSLLRLLTHYRWWPVLAHFLPDDAPRISLWASPAQQQLELDILRNWWLIKRGQ